jgi:ribosome-binding protein aMBF1 (putative translation factor)
MTIPFEKFKARLLSNPKVKAKYDALAPEFEIAAELLRARLRAGLSQAELAARMRTSQSTIARLESGQTLPSTKTLLRYADMRQPAASSKCDCRQLDAAVARDSVRTLRKIAE